MTVHPLATPVSRVVRAVIPAAGKGTRMYPATAAVPKELLAIGNHPLLEFALDELRGAGIREIVLVTARGKSAIEDFVEDWCARHGAPVRFAYVRQREQKGLGDAVLCAQHLLDDEAFAVLLPDDLLLGAESTLRHMIRLYERTQAPVIALQSITPEETKRYGVPVIVGELPEGCSIRGLVEKPGPARAPSLLGVVGRYVLPPTVFEYLHRIEAGRDGEIQLTDALDAMAADRGAWGLRLVQRRIDCGSPAGFFEAQLRTAGIAAGNPARSDATVLEVPAHVWRDSTVAATGNASAEDAIASVADTPGLADR